MPENEVGSEHVESARQSLEQAAMFYGPAVIKAAVESMDPKATVNLETGIKLASSSESK